MGLQDYIRDTENGVWIPTPVAQQLELFTLWQRISNKKNGAGDTAPFFNMLLDSRNQVYLIKAALSLAGAEARITSATR